MRHRRLATFFAPEPGHGNNGGGEPALASSPAVEEWNIETYRLAAPGTKILRPGMGAVDRVDRLAIKSEADGSPRMLPEALGFLWKNGEVPPAALPELLHRLGAEFRGRRDFDPVLGRSRAGARMAAWGFMAMVTLLLSAFVLSRLFPPGSFHGPEFVQTALERWLTEPMRPGVFVVTQGAVQAAAVVELPADYRPPPESFDTLPVAAGRAPSYSLARVQAAGEQRLVLVSDYERTLLPRVYPGGVAVPTETLALPVATLADISAGTRDLNTALVLGNHVIPRAPRSWRAPFAGSEYLWVAPVLLLALTALPITLGGLVMGARRARRLRQVRGLRQRLGLPVNPPTTTAAPDR